MAGISIEKLHLEVTRNCTLECLHCFRGEREIENMAISTIQKVLKNVHHIDFLLLTGGEPFLAVEQLEKVVEMIRTNGIKVDEVSIITNGTVLSPRIIKVLDFFDSNSRLYLTISKDKFHTMELEKKGLCEVRDKNVSVLKEMFGVYEYLPNRLPKLIQRVGRAVNLTDEELSEINDMGDVQTKYTLGDDKDVDKARRRYPKPVFDGKRIRNCLSIAVNGNIVPSYCSFIEEDSLAYARFNRFRSYPEMVSAIDTADDSLAKIKVKEDKRKTSK